MKSEVSDVFESIPVEFLTTHLPWVAGVACICAFLGAQYLCDHYVRRQKILSTGSPIPGWVSYLSLTGFVGSIACGIWSFTITWWAPIPVLVAPFLLRLLLPSDNFNTWLSMVRHFEKAEGSEFQRLCVATAMSALEDRTLRKTVRQLSSADQLVFMMAYECAVMWCLRRGMDGLLKPEEIESAIVAMTLHFAKHAWYQPKVFQEIWDRMQDLMPISMDNPKGPYPVADMIMAANMAGCPFNVSKVTDIRFGIYVALSLGALVPLGRSLAGDFSNVSPECQDQSQGEA